MTAINPEKKIIVGNALNAKLINPTWNPTSGINDLNKKSLPASEKLINFVKDKDFLKYIRDTRYFEDF